MNWFYAANNSQTGPLDQMEFDRLVQAGVITEDTLVWREGMANWAAYAVVARASVAQDATIGPAGTVRCVECGQWFAPDQVVQLVTGQVCAACKPIALQKIQEGATDTSAERVRKEHINHEASVRSAGFLYIVGGVLVLLSALPWLIGASQPNTPAFALVISLVLAGLGALGLYVGIGMRRLKPWARIAGAVVSGIGLLAFPMGTLINAYILYLLLSKKGVMVFSPEYKQVIAQTPHIKYKTSIIVWVFLGLLLLLLLVAFLGIALRATR